MGQACHWSLNRLPWQITLHSCPPTVEIKLCPVSASFVFSSLCLFLCLSSLPLPLFPLPRSPYSFNCGGPYKSAQLEEAFGGGGGLWEKREELHNSPGSFLRKQKVSAFTAKQHNGSTFLHGLPLINTSISIHTNKDVNTGAQAEAALTRCLGASWTASCCTRGPCLLFCLFVGGGVVCVVVKVKSKHSGSSSDVWTRRECPPGPVKQLDPLAATSGWRGNQTEHRTPRDRAV